jgi:hypothetical protein
MEVYAPESLTLYLIVTAIIFSAIIAVLSAVIVTVVEGYFREFFSRFIANWRYLTSVSVPVGVIAFASGYLTSVSRSPAVGTVLPAVLALFGGLNVYIFGSESKYKGVTGYCVCLFAVMLLYGTQYGAFRLDRERTARLMELTRQELIIRTVRMNLDLPADIPVWILPSDLK